jgi:dienelactone hydrolase
MKFTAPLTAVLTVAGLVAATPCVRADELVQVATQRAGLPAEANNTPPLFGYLARPPDTGPHPAVVILHGCSGFTPHYVGVAATLRPWGYVTLALDSLGDADVCDTVARTTAGSDAEVKDAYTALHYLSSQSFVDPQRIAVMGYSMGGWALLKAIERGPLSASEVDHFHAAVAYYPWCASSNGVMTAPTLILMGDRDDWTPATHCQKMAAHESIAGVERPNEGEPVKLVIYPGATHAFDQQGRPPTFMGHTLIYDANAAKDAEAQVHEFLDGVFGELAQNH